MPAQLYIDNIYDLYDKKMTCTQALIKTKQDICENHKQLPVQLPLFEQSKQMHHHMK